MRVPSSMMCIRPVTSLLSGACLMGAVMTISCSERAPELSSPAQRHADRMLDQLQRVSPLQRAAAQLPVDPMPAEPTPAAVEAPASVAVAEVPSADAGAAPPEPEEPPPPAASSPEEPSPEPSLAADAGAPEPTPPAEPPADAGASEPPRDIVAEAALPIRALVDGQLLTEAQLWERLAQAPVTCFGELHNRVTDHYAESRALAELVSRAGERPLALGMEMFQRPFQAPLSAYVRGELDEAGLITATEYVERWGYDFAFYRPLLETARSQGLPALALNAPRELTRKIGRTGLESLDERELAQLPELDLDDAEHRAFIFGLLGAVDHDVQLALENVYVAQTVWDETMAETSASWLAGAGPGAQLLIIAGAAHCHESAIPRRLSRRLATQAAADGFEVTSLAVALASELGSPDFTGEGYDVLVVLEDIPLPAELPPVVSPPAEPPPAEPPQTE